MELIDIVNYIKQSPIIPVVFAGLITIIILMQSLTKHRFLMVRFIISVLLTFCAVLLLIFYDEQMSQNNETVTILTYSGMIAVDVFAFILLFTIIDLSFSNETFQKELKSTLDETKLFVLLNKKDKVKEISSYFLKVLEIEEKDAIGYNFFDVLETKYRIIGLNDEGCTKAEIKKHYRNYGKRVQEGDKHQLEIDLQDDNAKEDKMGFIESVIFSGGKYRGRILFGEKRDEELLIGSEKREFEAKSELDLIKGRFIAIINKTTDGIFFNTLNNGKMWVNYTVTNNLFLNSNNLSNQEFYERLLPDDYTQYQEKINELQNGDDYQITYRYNVGNYYLYVKEAGRKIVVGDTIELAGVLTIINDNSYEKTGTLLDQIGTEPDLLNKLRELYATEKAYQLVRFKIHSIPEINEKFGRTIGNSSINAYVQNFKEKYVDENMIYRIGGLEFAAIITSYNRMEALRSSLRNEERVLHNIVTYAGEKANIDVYMGICMSNEGNTPKDVLKNTKDALMYCSNPNFTASYVYYKDMRYGG